MSGPSVTVQRAPDGWTHIGGPGMHLLIALDEEDDRTLTASDAADGGDLDDVIDVLTTGGMRRAHHFVGVHWEPRTRIVAFGPVAARVILADGSERDVRPASPRVWTDVELDEHPESVDLRVLDDTELPSVGHNVPVERPDPVERHEPVERPEPVFRAEEVERAEESARAVTSPAPEAPEVRPSQTAPTLTGTATDEPSAPSRRWDEGWRRTETKSPSEWPSPPEPSPQLRPPQPPQQPAPALRPWGSGRPVAARQVQSPTHAQPPTPAPGGTAPSTEIPGPLQRGVPTGNGSSGASAAAYEDERPQSSPRRDVHSTWAARPRPEEHAEEEAPAGPSYDYLFGGTVTAEEHRRLLAGAEPDEPDDEPEAAAPEPAPAAPETPTGPASPATPSAPPAAAAPEPGGLISSVPWATQPANPGSGAEPAPAFTGRHSPPPAPTLLPTAAAPSPQPPAPMPRPPADPASHTIAAEPDDAELTVDRSALLAARNAALDGGPGPRVMAVLCAAGHSSPPHANHCRVCGEPIPPQEPFEMPRPALGILRLSTGDIVTLDRNVLFGRAPKPVDGLSAEEQPHVVKVPSPERDVSRNHVEVLVEGWHVLIRDLGTTNGTTVALPGETAVRLRANDQQSLEPGSVVSMADEVSFIFEVGS